MDYLKIFFGLVCLIIPILFIGFKFNIFGGKHSFEITQASITQTIRETPIQLVANTITTMVFCTIDDIPQNSARKISNVILGKDEGIFIAKVKYVYGIDLLDSMTEDNVSIDDQSITIILPEPKMLYKEIDLDYEVQTKSTVWRSLVNKFTGMNVEKEMRIVFQEKAEEFAKANGLEPSKRDIINTLTPFFNKLFAEKTSKSIIFK
ncbi:MAG: DUF4230 domain-containing protein [Synergistaceae bacterium]|jgi:hypothetical protein|nr:DUF4230 domain-containing protein [Synergistaceae bacterium]